MPTEPRTWKLVIGLLCAASMAVGWFQAAQGQAAEKEPTKRVEWSDGVGAEVTHTEKHWAYVTPVRSALPAVKNRSWVKNPIDYFVLSRLEREGLTPSPPAERARLIRRVYLDLIGLPPTVEQVDEFLSNQSSDAFEKVVNRLLASPRYGERWARPWLDLARYADSNGYQADQYRSVWPYRDWVINAMNGDMPFDQFTIEQMAGDLLSAPTLDQKIATGFHRLTTCNVEAGVDPEENRVEQIIDRVNTTGTVWLGTSIECAQCHNHKYDPFTQRDYYRLFAYFNNTPIEVAGDGVTYNFTGPKMPLPLEEKQEARRKQLQQQHDQLAKDLKRQIADASKHQLQWEQQIAAEEKTAPQCRELEGVAAASSGGDPAQAAVPSAIAKILAVPREKRNKKQKQELSDYYTNLQPDIKKLRGQVAGVKKQLDATQPPTTLVMVEMQKPRTTTVFGRGNFLDKGAVVAASTPKVLHRPPADLQANRLGLARWIVHPHNPLVGRVTVNRWWAEIFGSGIVSTLEDFGVQGEQPTHPKLLDWLALELVESGWSMKHIHRLIVTSATYQQSARVTPQMLKRDPYNRLYARGARIRLAAEMIRDSALAASGLLTSKMAGPPVYPPQPDGIWRHVGRNAPKYATSTGTDRYRRGVYVVWRRSAPYASFVNFDAPDRSLCVPERPRTNTPLQALTLLNDPAYIEMAIALAERMMTDQPEMTVEQRVAYGFRRCLSRQPKPKELQHLREVYERELRRLKANTKLARQLVRTRNSSKATDDAALAAWFFVANILLNLDEMITKG